MKSLSIIKVLLVFLLLSAANLHAQTTAKLVTPNASKEAVALFKYINAMYGKKILSGQMWSSWGIDELKYVQEVTGKQPALRGMDFINERENEAETQRAIDWWKAGGIPTIMWHWGAPGIGDGYENSKKAIDIDKCFEEGTPEYKAFWSELEKKANYLEKIRDANVPVLWRPFHELNGNWFWWGKQGPEKFKRLWKTMYDYMVNKRKLNNLIWVLCYTGNPQAEWYPGKEYVDIAGADTYNVGDSPQGVMYKKVKDIVGDKMPITYHECGTPPDPDKCLSEGIMWSWWMEWHTSHLQKVDKEYLKRVYSHDLIITRDEVPNIMKEYGKK
jgi:beta-mannanase